MTKRPKGTDAIDPIKAIKSIRDVADLGHQWAPVPKTGFTVGVEIPVTKKELGGVLQGFENGDHRLKAEWTVHNDLMREDIKTSDRVVLYLHGGGFLVRCSNLATA